MFASERSEVGGRRGATRGVLQLCAETLILPRMTQIAAEEEGECCACASSWNRRRHGEDGHGELERFCEGPHPALARGIGIWDRQRGERATWTWVRVGHRHRGA